MSRAQRIRRLAGTAARRRTRDERAERVASRAELRRLRRQTAGPSPFERSERRMRVALLGPADDAQVRRWADFYAARGIDVYAISLADARDPGPRRPLVRTAYLPVLPGSVARSVVSPLAVRRLRALLDQAQPDVVHAHLVDGSGRNGYALLGALADRRPYVVSLMGEPAGAAEERGPHRVLRRALRRADAVVTIGAETDDPGSWDRIATGMLDIYAGLGLSGK